MVYLFIFILILTFMLLLMNYILSHLNYSREKLSSFECGFDQSLSSRVPFSLHFFLVAMIFLIFDVELALLLLFPLVFNFLSTIYFYSALMMFIFILILGSIVEWQEGSLNWSF